jgi:large subunit ribosomal protein L24
MHIRVGDTVQVMAGADRGSADAPTRGKVLRVLRSEHKVVVEGVNRVHKHIRRGPKNPQGGRLSKEMPISWSNVMLVCERCNQPARTGARLLPDGAKERYCKKCGAGIGQIAPPRPARAKLAARAQALAK